MVTNFPVGYTPAGDNVAGSGICLGLLWQVDEDTAIMGLTFDAPGSATASAALYAVGAGGGGDGSRLFYDTGIAIVSGANVIDFDDPITLLAGRKYLVMFGLGAGGHYGVVNNGGTELDQGPFSSVNPYWNVYIDGTPTLPLTASGIPLDDPPFTQSLNYYGVGVWYDALPSKVVFTRSRVDDNHISVDWTMPGDAPEGVSILRAPGTHTGDDTDGRPPSDPAYDPTGFTGIVSIADGLTDGPYVDTLPAPGIYTYWVVRSDL